MSDDPRPASDPGPQPEPPLEPWPEAPAAADSAPPPEAPRPVNPIPSARDIVSGGLDLNVAASSDIRSAAVLIGLLTLATAGPLVAIILAIGAQPGGFDWLILSLNGIRPQSAPIDPATGLPLVVAFVVGIGSVTALSVDSQLLAVIVTASKATGRPFLIRRALEISRLRFWPLLRANFLIGLILTIPNVIVGQVVGTAGEVTTESQFVVRTVIGVLLSVPFAYVSAWIILGPVGARESVRRSWRLARLRLRLALLIAIVNTAFGTIAGFAIGSGLDILIRLVDFFGLGSVTGVGQVILLVAIVAAGIVAVGSLTMTISALTAGPQVVAFLGLTGITNGLDVLHDPDNPFATPRVEPLVSRPMKVAIVVAVIAGVLGVIAQVG
jgi:hypothetical protein